MMDDMAAVRIADQLGAISVPTLVTWGDKDTVIPFPAIVEAFTSIPGCSLEVWHGVGHSGPIEIPERFTVLLTTVHARGDGAKGAGRIAVSTTALCPSPIFNIFLTLLRYRL